MDDCNEFPAPIKAEEPLDTDENGSKAKMYWSNSSDYFLGMMMYLVSNTQPDIYFPSHQCEFFTHNTKE